MSADEFGNERDRGRFRSTASRRAIRQYGEEHDCSYEPPSGALVSALRRHKREGLGLPRGDFRAWLTGDVYEGSGAELVLSQHTPMFGRDGQEQQQETATMGSVQDMFGSKSSISAKDLDGKGRVPLVIEKVEAKEFDDGKKLIVRFRGTDKALVCNKTNANRIAEMHGDDYDGWPGKRIELYRTMTDFQGERVPCVRVFVEDDAPPPPEPEPPSDDVVPF